MTDEDLLFLSEVDDEKSFIAYIRFLADKRTLLEQKGHDGDWEHGTIGNYLDAVAARGESGAGYDFDEASRADNPWRRAARILLYGKYYE